MRNNITMTFTRKEWIIITLGLMKVANIKEEDQWIWEIEEKIEKELNEEG